MPGITEGERLIKYNNEIIFEVGRHVMRMPGGVTNNFILRRYNFYVRAFVVSIHYYKSTVRSRKCKTKHGSSFCWSNFSGNIVICQVYAVIIWLNCFRFM